MACDSSIFRPINSFIKYFGDIKPYHTKILEVVEQYVFREEINVYIDETPTFELTVSNNPLCKGVGFGLDFDDACGFDALECCDLFECVGGFGLVFDNSDLLVTAQVNSIDGSSGQLNIPFEGVPLHNTGNGQVHVAGNHLYDTFINIKSIPNLGEIRLDGDYSSYFNSHNLFWVVRKNSLAINSILTPITFTLTGNHVDALLAKINFEVLNAGLNDGHYGVVNATYNTGTGLTTVTTNRELPANTLGTILFESNNKNNGVYQVASFSVVAGETRIILEAETQARYMDAEIPEEEGYGAIQLRTGFVPNRKLWIENDNTPNPYPPFPGIPDNGSPFPNNGEWKINQAWYDVSSDETIIVVDGTLLTSTNPSTVIKLYGYETAAGYDALNECSEPQPFNINASISEYVVIQVIDIPLPSMPATVTPTITVTSTVTPSITPTLTPTITATVTPTITPSASGVTGLPIPLHHWAFDGDTLDSIGNNDGTIIDDTGLESVKLVTIDGKGAIYFRKNSYAGANYFANTVLTLDSPLTSNILTVEGWIYATDDDFAFYNVGEYAITMLSNDDDDNVLFTMFILPEEDGDPYTYFGSSYPARSEIVGKWSHNVISYNGTTGTIKWYVNGNLISDDNYGAIPSLSYDKIGIFGSFNENSYATAAYMADIKYYNTELSGTDVAALFSASSPSYTPNNPPQPSITPTPTPSVGAANGMSLLHFDDYNGSTTITDARGQLTWTATAAQLTSDEYLFGTNSATFNPNGRIQSDTSRLIIGHSATIQAWIFPIAFSGYQMIVSQDDGASNNVCFQFRINSGGYLELVGWTDSSRATSWTITSTNTVNTGVWTHVAFVKDGTDEVRIYINGVLEASTSNVMRGVSRPIAIGNFFSTLYDNYFNGYIDEFKISETVEYTGNFTPPAGPFT